MKTTPLKYSYSVDASRRIINRSSGAAMPAQATTSLFLNDDKLIEDGILPLDSTGRDLFAIGTSILTADRLSPRKHPRAREAAAELNWQRQIEVDIAIEQPHIWNRHREQLESLLRLLTDDTWSVSFTPAPQGPRQIPLFSSPPPQDAEVALYSGGLDSAAGMFVRSSQQHLHFVSVSLYGDNLRHKTQQASLALLRNLGVNVQSVSVVHQIRRNASIREDATQRSRAVAYLFLGAAVANACNLSSVASYEAGPGALNLPMNDAQVASQNTRATHPEVLRQCEALLRQVLNRPSMSLNLPFILKTKGEVCRAADQVALAQIAGLSCSCDEGEGHKPDLLHCGFCTSCLLRRAALYAALGPSDPTNYKLNSTTRHGRYDTEAFRFQALTLFDSSKSFKSLLLLDPLLRHAVTYLTERGLNRERAEVELCEVLARHARETLNWLDAGGTSLRKKVSP